MPPAVTRVIVPRLISRKVVPQKGRAQNDVNASISIDARSYSVVIYSATRFRKFWHASIGSSENRKKGRRKRDLSEPTLRVEATVKRRIDALIAREPSIRASRRWGIGRVWFPAKHVARRTRSQRLWSAPEFGDAELAAMITPRPLLHRAYRLSERPMDRGKGEVHRGMLDESLIDLSELERARRLTQRLELPSPWLHEFNAMLQALALPLESPHWH